MADLRERIPIVGSIIKGQRQLLETHEADIAYMEELAEEVKDWQAIAAQADDKDVTWTDYKKNHEDAWEAYVENPLAKGYIDRLTDFVIKDGFEVVSEDEDTQKAIDEFLELNDWPTFQHDACREVSIFGEIFARFFDGADFAETTLTDPSSIRTIDVDPENVKDVKRYLQEFHVVEFDNDGAEVKQTLKTNWIPADEIVSLKINTVSNARRGISDLLCILKWLTRHKQVATNLVRRSNIQMSVIGEKIIKGPGGNTTTAGGWRKSGDDASSPITGKRTERTVKPGTWYVHSPNIEYKFTALPNDVKGMVDLLSALLKIIVAGVGLSEHWLGDTSESNLATATSVEIPIMAKFERRQNELKGFFKRYVAKGLESNDIENAEFDVIAPEISARDAEAFAKSLKVLAEGLEISAREGWISDESAAKTIGDSLDHFDSFDEEQEKIANQERVRREEEEVEPIEQVTVIPGQEITAEAFNKAIKEAEFTFQQDEMDEILDNYVSTYKSAVNKARKKTLSSLRKQADDRKK